jgi:glucose-1-phosphate cytidylyltransferase
MEVGQMKAIILAGGMGTRLSEETHLRPKPMIEIGGRPMIWHVMKSYSHHGINDFIVCLGYKGYIIKEYFANYFLHMSDVTISTGDNSIEVHNRKSESWRITLVDTGETTLTGGRLKRVHNYLEEDERFCFTYGDGVADVDITASIKFHESSGRLCTLTAVQPPGRYGALERKGNQITGFREKILGDGGWINGGYFVAEKEVLDLIDGDGMAWEGYPLESLAASDQLQAFEHEGFWHPMDTLRDKNYLEGLWQSGAAPWKLW